MSSKLTLLDVEKRVGEIKNKVIERDYEYAHSMEDDLYVDVLKAIAAGTRNSKQMAEAALKTQELDFPRWYA